jgi:hypothetical protein
VPWKECLAYFKGFFFPPMFSLLVWYFLLN